MEIGKAIKEIRKKALLSQQDFADALEVSFSTVNRWENGRAIPSYQALNKLKEFCGEHSIRFEVEKFVMEVKDESD